MVRTGAVPNPAQSVRDRVLDIIRTRIIALDFPPGVALSENELAAELGVSRTPVRESIIILREEGLVQVFPQVGTFVSRVDIERVHQAQFVREAIECASLDILGEIPRDELSKLRENIAAQRMAQASGEIDVFFALDEAFHRALLTLSGHAAAWSTVSSEKAHLDRARRMSLLEARPISTLIDQHERVVDGLEDHDGGQAVGALREHLRAVFDDIETIRQRSPELFAGTSADRPTRRTVSSLGL